MTGRIVIAAWAVAACTVLLTPVAGQGHRPAARGGPPWRTELPRQEWRDIVDGMTPEARAAFMALPPRVRARESRRLVEERRQREERAFLDALPEETRERVAALPDRERRAAVLRLRVRQKLDRVVTDARALGILDDLEAEATLALDDAEIQASRILELQKAVFLVLHEDVLGGLPPEVRGVLADLPPADFFRHPAVEEARYAGAFVRPALLRLRRGGEEVIRPFLEALAEDRLSAAEESSLRPHFREVLGRATAEERRRTAERMGRAVFFRELSRPGRRPPRDGFHLPPELFERLTPEEQAVFLRLPDGARRRLAERRFPELVGQARPSGDPSMADLLARWNGLTPREQRRLADAPVSAVIARLFAPPGDGPPRPVLRELMERLSAQEREELEALPPPERLRRLRERFPEAFRPR